MLLCGRGAHLTVRLLLCRSAMSIKAILMPSLYLDETHRKISPSTDVSRKLWILSSTKMEQLRPSPSQTVQEFHKKKAGRAEPPPGLLYSRWACRGLERYLLARRGKVSPTGGRNEKEKPHASCCHYRHHNDDNCFIREPSH